MTDSAVMPDSVFQGGKEIVLINEPKISTLHWQKRDYWLSSSLMIELALRERTYYRHRKKLQEHFPEFEVKQGEIIDDFCAYCFCKFEELIRQAEGSDRQKLSIAVRQINNPEVFRTSEYFDKFDNEQ